MCVHKKQNIYSHENNVRLKSINYLQIKVITASTDLGEGLLYLNIFLVNLVMGRNKRATETK